MQRDVLPEKAIGKEAPKCSRDSSIDNNDFSELVRLHWSQVFGTCLRIVRNHHDAEDAAQDCFLRAFSHIDQFKGEAQISTWLTSIARNCSLLLLRKRKCKREVSVDDSSDSKGNQGLFDSPDSAPDQLNRFLYAESFGLLVKSIAALPDALRATADLVILNERSPQEVDQILEVSSAAVKSRLYRARRRLIRVSKARQRVSSGLSRN